MKRTARTLTLAAPLVAVTLGLGASPALAGPAIEQATTAHLAPADPHLPVDLEKVPADPDPDPGPGFGGSDDLTTEPPCPTHGPCGTDPGDEDEKDPGDDSSTGVDIDRPTRIDAGTAATTAGQDGDELAWLLTGGLVVAMTGAAYAARRRERSTAI